MSDEFLHELGGLDEAAKKNPQFFLDPEFDDIPKCLPQLKRDARRKHVKDLEETRSELGKTFLQAFKVLGHSNPDFDGCSCRAGL